MNSVKATVTLGNGWDIELKKIDDSKWPLPNKDRERLAAEIKELFSEEGRGFRHIDLADIHIEV